MARTVTLTGVTGQVVEVQADVSSGLVGTTLVGRPDASVSEARDRCRTASLGASLEWPKAHRVTVLLSPADLPKRGSHFDLAIAAAVLAAHEKSLQAEDLRDTVLIGELTLDGRLREVHGVLPMVLAARNHGVPRVVVPELHLEEAGLVPGVDVRGVRTLRQAVALLRGQPLPEAEPMPPPADARLLHWPGSEDETPLDLADVHGMEDTRLALEVAAAGGHHLLLSGPRGSGKTTLAERVPGLLPDLSVEEALELGAVHSLAGELRPGEVPSRPPFRAPHHSASRSSVLGGGTGRVRPGEVSRALHGVLFLDEFPLFATDIIDALRQPLESGEVTIARGEEVATFPARTMVVLAANPCPCGDYHPDARESRCTCSEVRRRTYRERVSGPVTDRVDVVRHLTPVRAHHATGPWAPRESTAEVRSRVEAARSRQRSRLTGTPWALNAHVPGPVLAARWPLPPAAARLLEGELAAGRLTRRGVVRAHRLAWTLADLRAAERPSADDAALAVLLRAGQPLPEGALRRTGS